MSSDAEAAAANAATACAVAMIAQQIAGKAARDALFLSSFDVTSLPAMVIGAAILSIVVVLVMGGVMTRYTPQRVVPTAFFASGVLTALEFGLLFVAPRAVAVVFYLHMAAFGAILISGFWSLVNERFDPRTAKQKVGRIAAGATAGGVAGGILAERVAALGSTEMVLPALAVLHLACGWAAARIFAGVAAPAGAEDEDEEQHVESGIAVLRKVSHLRNLGVLLLMGTVAAGLIDYVFKAQASAAFTDKEGLLRFFALFYMGASVLTFLVQSTLTTPILERFGLGGTVGTNPIAVAAGGVVALFAPGLWSAGLVRAGETVTRSSLFRSGYELLYTPIAKKDKRATKTIIDVGFDRLGDALGGGLVSLLLLLPAALATSAMLGVAVALSLAGIWLTRRLQQGYVSELEKSLLTRAEELDLDDVQDNVTRSTILQTLGSMNLRDVLKDAAQKAREAAEKGAAAREAVARVEQQSAQPMTLEPSMARIVELRSGDAHRVRGAILMGALEPMHGPHLIALLGWDEVRADVARALKPLAKRITGQLADALLDPREEFAIRRRIPAILKYGEPHRAAEALLRGLADKRFEVRFRCGRALALLRRKHEDLEIPTEQVYEVVKQEAVVGRNVWDSRKLLDGLEEDEESELVDGVILDRANRSLEHAFTLLSLVLPSQPLKVAFRALHTDDKTLRGTALEYLETTLPEGIRAGLWPFLEGDAVEVTTGVRRGHEGNVLESLMMSTESIELRLVALRKRLGGEADAPETS